MYIQPRRNSKSRWLSSQFTVCRLRAKCLFTSVTWEVEDCLMLSLLSVCEKSWSCDLIFHANTRVDVTVIQPRRGCQYACNQWIQLDLITEQSQIYVSHNSKFVYSGEIVMWDDRQFVWETDQCLIDDNIMNHFFSLSFMFLRFFFQNQKQIHALIHSRLIFFINYFILPNQHEIGLEHDIYLFNKVLTVSLYVSKRRRRVKRQQMRFQLFVFSLSISLPSIMSSFELFFLRL